MNFLTGIIVAVVGVVIVVLSVLKVVPGLTGTGIGLILLGALLFGLSFVPRPNAGDTPRMSTPSTLLNIFLSPSEVYQNLRRHPRWLVAVLVMAILGAVYNNAFMQRLTPERVANYAIDKTLEMPMMNDEARRQIEANRGQSIADAKNPVIRAGQAVNGFVGQVFLYAFMALVFFLFALAMGGQMNYWQAFSAAVYAFFPIAVIRFVLNSIILFVKDPVDIHPILGQQGLLQDSLGFLFSPAQNPVLFSLLSAFSLTAFIWMWLNATGLKNAGEKVSGGAAWTATIAFFLLGVTLSVLMAAAFGSFMS